MPKHRTSREEILTQSYQVFREKGYHQTSIAQLAKACGIEKPHFYYYFKSKEDLMVAVLQYARSKMNEWVFSKAYNEDYTPEQRWNKIMENLLTIHKQHSDGCIMGNTILEIANTSPELLKPIQAYFKDAQNALVHLLKTKLPERKSVLRAERYFREYQGALMLMRLYQDPNRLVEVLQMMKEEFPILDPISGIDARQQVQSRVKSIPS